MVFKKAIFTKFKIFMSFFFITKSYDIENL